MSVERTRSWLWAAATILLAAALYEAVAESGVFARALMPTLPKIATTLVDNIASQRVLEKNDFERIGLARGFLRIAGDWRDFYLFQRLAD